MTLNTRYFMISLVYGLVILGMISQSYSLLLGILAAAAIFGIWLEKVDNRRDEPFKHYNAVHNYHH